MHARELQSDAASDRLCAARAHFDDDVVLSEPFPGRPPLWIEPKDPALRTDLRAAADWMDRHNEAIEAALLSFGAVFWRGFPVREAADFAALMRSFEIYAQGYVAGTTDRKVVDGDVMEATRTPEHVFILPHQEMSYLTANPRLVGFFCKQPSPVGGETIFADMRGFLEALPEALRAKFLQQEIRYVRNLRSADIDDWRADPALRHPTWQYRFGTRDRAAIDAQLQERDISFRWEDDGSLTFWTQLLGVRNHPATGERLYCNHIYPNGQHRISMGDERADLMDAAYGATKQRPYAPTFSNGERLSEDEFMTIHELMQGRKVAFPWQPGDIMIVENMLTAHGRHPYSGPRDVQVMLFQ